MQCASAPSNSRPGAAVAGSYGGYPWGLVGSTSIVRAHAEPHGAATVYLPTWPACTGKWWVLAPLYLLSRCGTGMSKSSLGIWRLVVLVRVMNAPSVPCSRFDPSPRLCRRLLGHSRPPPQTPHFLFPILYPLFSERHRFHSRRTPGPSLPFTCRFDNVFWSFGATGSDPRPRQFKQRR